MNFEKSFRITLMTLRLISDASQNSGDQSHKSEHEAHSPSLSLNVNPNDEALRSIPNGDAVDGSVVLTIRHMFERIQRSSHQDGSCAETLSSDSCGSQLAFSAGTGTAFESVDTQTSDDGEAYGGNCDTKRSGMNQQLVVQDVNFLRHLERDTGNASTSSSMLTTMEKSVFEQTRSNDLKAFEISLMMKKLNLQEKKMALKSDSNFLERLKLSIGLSKASFKADKFKTQLQEAREVELLKKCLDFLVAGLIIMLFSLGYGTYTYSYRRIIEASEACSPVSDSNSWRSYFMPESMSTFSSGLQSLRCQVQVFSRMIFGALVIAAITVLLVQRSASSHQGMPITFILLLLGVVCGYAGKFCVETLGGSGYCWLIYWEALCLLHFVSIMFRSMLYVLLYGPIIVAESVMHIPPVPFWMRRLMFFTTLVVLPLMCGFMPFASVPEWYNHFRASSVDFANPDED